MAICDPKPTFVFVGFGLSGTVWGSGAFPQCRQLVGACKLLPFAEMNVCPLQEIFSHFRVHFRKWSEYFICGSEILKAAARVAKFWAFQIRSKKSMDGMACFWMVCFWSVLWMVCFWCPSFSSGSGFTMFEDPPAIAL